MTRQSELYSLLVKYKAIVQDDVLSLCEFQHNSPLKESYATLHSCTHIVQFLNFLKNDEILSFEMLLDVCAVDYPDREKRFEVVYHLLSVTNNWRLRVHLPISQDEAIPSVYQIYRSSDWYEREVYDMFGIKFLSHPNLKRILNESDFTHHPLRKDFPLSGYHDACFEPNTGTVVKKPIVLDQAYRNFDSENPWKDVVLPGDEKATKG
ncbi:NADH-quinone oxidoreductase subunit C [Candidatus Fokinia solitaria]|uniref:NADH-quinone oxidoreductase subunit C n=1 Tax=Candidatus Fokinia solitaria TaxID=1802984 RepID=A0A2U8BT20_9RICK|nr:NADH-quinone oxidoreductase subunit C [Candidatus Fokinia solitaria]AWD33455.1 NADH-quinone oxidoreductase subunit C [Candidatus Fokinia solitaria]